MKSCRYVWKAAVWSAVALVALVACGEGRTSPTPSDSSPGWKSYVSSKWGWSIQYPASWFDLPNYGAPNTEKYFATENVGSPLGLESDRGLWLTIETFEHSCEPRYDKAEVVEETPITVAGSSTKYVVRGPDIDAYFSGAVSVTRGTRCYLLGFLASNFETLEESAQVIEEILESFRV